MIFPSLKKSQIHYDLKLHAKAIYYLAFKKKFEWNHCMLINTSCFALTLKCIEVD